MLDEPDQDVSAAGGDDEQLVYVPAMLMHEGIGATVWSSRDRGHERASALTEQDVEARFIPYEQCPPHVQAMLVTRAVKMLGRLMEDVRLADGRGPLDQSGLPAA